MDTSSKHVEQFLKPTSEHLSSQLGYKHFVPCFFGFCVHLGASWEDVECTLGALEAILGLFWELSGATWKLLGGMVSSFWNPPLSILAISLGTNTLYPASLDPVFILVSLGTILGAFWNLLGRSWAYLGTPWEILESSWNPFFASWENVFCDNLTLTHVSLMNYIING